MHVVERLQRDGWHVRALVRDAGRAGTLGRTGVELATGDILDAASITAAARGCDILCHTAAAVTPRGGWEAYSRPNIDGTRNAIAAASTVGARLVHVSSVAVYGPSARYTGGAGTTSEDSSLTPLPERAYYARSKRDSEALVMQAHASGRVWATALRPAVVYGAHDRQFVPRVARIARHGIVPLVAGGRTTLAVVHAANVADGIVRAATSRIAGGRAYNLANDFDVTVAEFFRLATKGLGVRMRVVPVPEIAARAAVRLFTLVAPLFLGSQFDAAALASLDFVTRDNPFTSERARRELGWEPEVRPEVGVVDAFRWWAAHR
jgi:nucleoside-diphosphate-sugar epimerase